MRIATNETLMHVIECVRRGSDRKISSPGRVEDPREEIGGRYIYPWLDMRPCSASIARRQQRKTLSMVILVTNADDEDDTRHCHLA